jgi:hypothetical protein
LETGFSSLSESEELSLAAFLAAAFLATGLSESDPELLELSLAAAFLAGAAFLAAGFSSESESEEDEAAFLAGTALAAEVFWALFFPADPLLAPDSALLLLATGFLVATSELSLSEEELATTFLAIFLS